MTKIATHKVFSVPIFEFKLNDHIEINKELEKYIYDLMKKDEQGIKVSNQGGWHSPYFKINESKILIKFLEIIRSYLFDIISKEYGWKYDLNKIKIDGMWSVVNKQNSFNIKHNHPNCFLSAAYYVKVKKNCGKIKFFDPKEQKNIRYPAIEKFTELSAEVINFHPEEGVLLIFPSYLYHAVDENLSGEDRIVISFNVDREK
jgi:uncharacterized protein (TIGR02466 family)